MSCVVAFLVEIHAFENTSKVSFFFPKLWILFLFFCRLTMAMAAMKVVSAGGFMGVGCSKKKYPHGVVGPVFEKTPVFGVQLPKLDQLTVTRCPCSILLCMA